MSSVLEQPGPAVEEAPPALPAPPALTPTMPIDAAADSDLWGRLADVLACHPDWAESECRATVHTWMMIRRQDPWQAKLLKFWQRWKRHHEELRAGLARAGQISWAEKCRYCEIWSASRPAMSPFCGVAEILLETSTAEMKPQPAGFPASLKELESRPGDSPADRPGTSDIIVVSADADLATFTQYGASRQLVWALENCGFSWSLSSPGRAGAELDPLSVKGVVFWSYRHRRGDFAYHAQEVEKLCKARQIPVLNSIRTGWDIRHSTILQNFARAGIRCPRFQKFSHVDEITLPFPLILRVDGMHRGQQMHLVRDMAEARALLRSLRVRFVTEPGPHGLPPPNLAVEYIDVADDRGLFHKYRAYVVGSQVILRHKTVGPNWLVNFASADSVGGAAHAGEAGRGGHADVNLIARAGRASGSDVTALDYSIAPNGEYVFWEANRMFMMNGDENYGLSESVSDSAVQRRALVDRKLGESLLALLQDRFAHSSR